MADEADMDCVEETTVPSIDESTQGANDDSNIG